MKAIDLLVPSSLNVSVLAEGLRHVLPNIRAVAASHPEITRELVYIALEDEDWYVRRCALAAPCLSVRDLFELMSSHHYLDVREYAQTVVLAKI